MRSAAVVAVIASALAVAWSPPSHAGDADDLGALVRALPASKVTLAAGIRHAEKGGAAAISAKFEFDAKGALMLSVYVAEKGLERDAEHNVLMELIGSPSEAVWTPEVEVFADVPHVARSAQQLALMSLSPLSLGALVERMEKDGGVVLSVTPVLKGRKALVLARTAKDGVVREWTWDLASGMLVAQVEETTTVRVAVKRHEFVREGEWVVEFGCAGVEDANGFVYFRIKEAPCAIGKILIANAKGDTVLAPAPDKDKGGFYQVNTGKEFGEATELRIFPQER